MISRTLTIVNKLGLHARAAAKLVTLASRYSSEIRLKRDGREVNAKSIMGVMTLAASRGTALEAQANGDDAEEAIQELEKLVSDRFGEPE